MKNLESPDAASAVGAFPLLLIGIEIARVPFLDATAGWAACWPSAQARPSALASTSATPPSIDRSPSCAPPP